MARLGPKEYWYVTKKTFTAFGEDSPFNYAAIISYYTVFSLPATLILILRVAGTFYGPEAVSGRLFGQIKGVVGAETAASIQEMVQAATKTSNSWWSLAIGIATLALSATTVFVSLQESLNNVWGVKAKPEKGWLKYLINRLLSISILGLFAFLLLVSLAADAFLQAVSGYIARIFSPAATVLVTILDIALNIALITGLFALIFKILPDAKVRWRNVWVGAFVTTLLFALGKFGIGWYISFSETASAYGAAGSIILIMVWVYYSSVILLLGAEFTKSYSQYLGEDIQPSTHAVAVEIKEIHKDAAGNVEHIKETTPEGVTKIDK